MVRYGDILSAGEDDLEIASLGGYFGSFLPFPVFLLIGLNSTR